MNVPFTADGYVATVDGLIVKGYEIRSFGSAAPDSKHLVLRHDIDQSIGRARKLAELEAGHNWRSVYFVLLRTEMYNPWSRDAAADLRAILDIGHEIGLHLDASLYPDADKLECGASAECEALELLLGRRVEFISFHRPASHLLGGDKLIAGRRHTYMDKYFREFGYCSDSRGGWHNGHPWNHPAISESRALQLLTHAVWWIGDNAEEPRERLTSVLNERVRTVERELSGNNNVWRSEAES